LLSLQTSGSESISNGVCNHSSPKLMNAFFFAMSMPRWMTGLIFAR
jgi:hypothetical protein